MGTKQLKSHEIVPQAGAGHADKAHLLNQWREKVKGAKNLSDWLAKAEAFCRAHGLEPFF